MENIFRKGLILGGLLALGTVAGLTLTKPGQELTAELQADFDVLLKTLQKKLYKLEHVTAESYKALVETVVEDFAAQKELVAESRLALTQKLQALWADMEQEYQAEV